MAADFYASDAGVEQYLLFHYGTPEQICPLLPEALEANHIMADFFLKQLSK